MVPEKPWRTHFTLYTFPDCKRITVDKELVETVRRGICSWGI